MSDRKRMSDTRRVRRDLLAIGPIKTLIRWPVFPVLLQVCLLVLIAFLTVNGWDIGSDRSTKELMTLRKTCLTTLVVWGLWWPFMIGLALLFGRIWCTVCPMELVNRVGDEIARRIGWPRARLGRFLEAGWVTLLAYLVLQALVAGFMLHRFPHYTSLLLIALFGMALVTGLLFRRPRSFCVAFCPAAALLSVYGRFTPVRLDVADGAICDDCTGRDCTRNRNRYRFDRRSCPSLLKPYERELSDSCVLCFQCAKVCPHDNVGFGLVDRNAASRRKRLLRPFEAVFVLIAAGFVTHEIAAEVKWFDRYFHYVPERLHSLVPDISFRWCEAVWFLLLFPMLVWMVVAAVGYLAGHRGGIKNLLLSAATGAAPVVAVAHLSKAIAKITGWAGYLPLSLADSAGEETFERIADQTLAPPERLAGLSIVGAIMLVVILWISWRGWRSIRETDRGSPIAAGAGLAVPAILYAAVLVVWCCT